MLTLLYWLCFFFQAEDGIRDDLVTGVQTCALPISVRPSVDRRPAAAQDVRHRGTEKALPAPARQRRYLVVRADRARRRLGSGGDGNHGPAIGRPEIPDSARRETVGPQRHAGPAVGRAV